MAETLLGLSGKRYLIQSHIKSGGEGGVYNTDQSDLVAKIYDTSKINIDARINELEEKVKYMVTHRIPTKLPDGTVIVTWPQDALYRNGKFVGYVMPKISNAQPIYMINRGGASANSVIPEYSWRKALTVSINLAYIVSYLHSKGVVIGDMNSDNLLVYSDGKVAVIDTDSFDLRDSVTNKHYKCSVGIAEFLPPELQGRNLESERVQYTQYTDDFALAVHIFQLLMNNYHPFSAKVITNYKQSVPENDQDHNIQVGNCPFVRKIPGIDIPVGSPVISELLPDYLVADFKNTFDYQLDLSSASYINNLAFYMKRRTTALKWHEDLKKLSQDLGLVPCSKNKSHYYLYPKGHCELCAAEERSKSIYRQAMSNSGSTRPVNANARNGTKVNAGAINNGRNVTKVNTGTTNNVGNVTQVNQGGNVTQANTGSSGKSWLFRIIGIILTGVFVYAGYYYIDEAVFLINNPLGYDWDEWYYLCDIVFGTGWLIFAIVCFIKLSVHKNIKLKDNCAVRMVLAISVIFIGMICSYYHWEWFSDRPIEQIIPPLICMFGVLLIPVKYK